MVKCQVALWICNIKKISLQTPFESVNGLNTLDWYTGRVSHGRGSMHKATSQNLPGDREVLSRDVYPQIVKDLQLCKATAVITSKMESCHAELCRPATGSYSLFSAQLAASVALSVLVLYGHISATGHNASGIIQVASVVAETPYIYWCHIEGCCNNPNGMSLQNLSFLSVMGMPRCFILTEYSC